MIDLSADLGEGSPGEDQIWPLISSANVACGGHTGDARSMREAAQRATSHRVRLGAHPSYPDREHFGRRSIEISPDALRESLVEQIASLRAFADISHVKPHGALYNDAHQKRGLADVIVDAIRRVDPSLAIVAPDTSQMAAAARAAGTPLIREAFGDRLYEPDGSLVSRAVPGATLSIDGSVAQADLLAREATVVARGGARIEIAFDTICIHADMEGAVARLRAIRRKLGL